MRFLYAFGLLGLIGVPVLIIIYIIKNKYTEQVIPSTYIWNLSEKFLKKKLPIHKLVGLISLILQIAAVVFISLSIAHPVFTVRGAANDYCFILDGSGSMNMVSSGKTRFESAKDEIAALINSSADGSAYSLVFVGYNTDKVFDNVTDKDTALKLLNGIQPTYNGTALTDALGEAQKYFDDNPAVSVYLATDKTFESSQNVTVINVAGREENYALSGVKYTETSDGFVVDGNVTSYRSNTSLTLEIYVNGSGTAAQTLEVDVDKGESVPFSFSLSGVDLRSAKVVISEPDAFSADSEITLYNVKYENAYQALLVSEQPFFLHAVLLSAGRANVKVVSPDDYKKILATTDGESLGYDLYVFDGFTPAVMPRDGAVWFFNPHGDVAQSGFTVQDEIELPDAQKPTYAEGGSTSIDAFLNNIDVARGEDIYVSKYVKCGTYRKFETILSLDGNPLVFTGTNEFGNREVVFAFDLHDSNFPLLPDYIVLTDNILQFTFPSVIDRVLYSSGEIMPINVVANCTGISVTTPKGKTHYIDTSGAVSEFELTEVGTYLINVTVGGTERTYNAYASVPESESNTTPLEQSFVISGTASSDRRDGVYGNILYLFIVLGVLCAADWVVYCYEQYQLR